MAYRKTKQGRNQFALTMKNIQHAVLMPAYIILVTALMLAMIYLAVNTGVDPLLILIVSLIAGVIFTVGGSFLYVLWDLQFSLQYEFDDIKNRIASGDIKSLDQFGKALHSFILHFFRYSFFSVMECAVLLKDRPVYDPGNITAADISALEDYASSSAGVTLFDKKITEQGKTYMYVLPIWFGNEYYGLILLYSGKRLPGIFRSFLSDFENNFIDDQLVHVYNKQFSSLP